MRRKRKVAIHMREDGPTVEGLLRSYRTDFSGGHYVVELAELVLAPGKTQELEGRWVRVPRERVAWIQELS